ncbi:MAG: (Fe-S)-binding protein [candidate division FCPU426 bacterium]
MRPKKVQLFPTCLVNELFPEVGFDVVTVLKKLDIEVEVPLTQVCCGQPAYNAGYTEDAKKVALNFIDAFEKTEGPIVAPSGSCSDMVAHHLPSLFADDPSLKARAEKVASRIREFSQFLVDDLGVTDLGGKLPASVAYHPSCHLSRGLGVKTQPQALIAGVKGATLNSAENMDECCGFGGSFSVTHDALSGAMLEAKMSCLDKAGAERIVSCDMGCLMHIEGGFRHKDQARKVQHLAQFLAESLR